MTGTDTESPGRTQHGIGGIGVVIVVIIVTLDLALATAFNLMIIGIGHVME